MTTQQGRFLFLGTGSSTGVPVIGCTCDVCRSPSPYNKRLRSSALLTVGNHIILIDAGPDLREQALKFNISRIDGLILTHSHYDHSGGMDELRIYSYKNKGPLPCLLSLETLTDLRQRFGYFFGPPNSPFSHTTKIDTHILTETRGHVQFLGLDIQYVSFDQARMRVDGFRFGNLAYISDICNITDSIINDMQGVEILIISALRFTDSHIHLTVDQAVEFAQKVGAKQAWLIHTAHELDYEKTNAYLPEYVRMAYDGLEIDFVANLSH